MHQDPISDLLTRVRNASLAKLTRVAVPSSKLKLEVLRILKEEGYIADYSISDKYHGIIKVYLKYKSGKSVISEINRVSRTGRSFDSHSDSIAKALGIEANRVNIKAKTNETMGFVGKGEGVAVFATATVERNF